MSTHKAGAPRSTLAIVISDAARQALSAYQDHFFHAIAEGEVCHFPHSRWGEIVAQIAPVLEVEQNWMIFTMELLAKTNIELSASQQELRSVRHQLDEARQETAF